MIETYHDDRFVNFLPQVGSENLDQRNLQCWNFAMHKDTSQIQLNLKPNVDISSVDGRRPPQHKSSIWNLV